MLNKLRHCCCSCMTTVGANSSFVSSISKHVSIIGQLFVNYLSIIYEGDISERDKNKLHSEQATTKLRYVHNTSIGDPELRPL